MCLLPFRVGASWVYLRGAVVHRHAAADTKQLHFPAWRTPHSARSGLPGCASDFPRG
jgi:hypothetical protein